MTAPGDVHSPDSGRARLRDDWIEEGAA